MMKWYIYDKKIVIEKVEIILKKSIKIILEN